MESRDRLSNGCPITDMTGDVQSCSHSHSVINKELRKWDQDKFGALYVLPQDRGTIPKGLIVASRNVWSSQATTGFCQDREWHCMLSPWNTHGSAVPPYIPTVVEHSNWTAYSELERLFDYAYLQCM